MRANTIVLTNGVEISANRGILGIDGTCTVYEGYDGYINLDYWNDESQSDEPKYTKAELNELADIAIKRWIDFKGKVDRGDIDTKL